MATPPEFFEEYMQQSYLRQIRELPEPTREILESPYEHDTIIIDEIRREEDTRFFQEAQLMANNAPPRRRGNLPPFEQLQQSIEARTLNNGSLRPHQINQFRETDFSTIADLTRISSTTGGFYPTKILWRKEGVDYNKQKNGNKWRALYIDWKIRNTKAVPEELNTNILYFRSQKRSIEVELLRAISNGTPLNTKTTTFDPKKYTVRLFGHEIVKIDKETYRISEITFPKEISNVNLFRHRLRQLGVRCLSISRETRVYLNGDTYSVITPGTVLNIPRHFSPLCLPRKVYGKTVIDLPNQLTLGFNDEWVRLPAFMQEIGNFVFELDYKPDPSGILFRGNVRVSAAGESQNLSENLIIAHKNLKPEKIKKAIGNLIRHLVVAVEEFNHSLYYKSNPFTITSTSAAASTTATMTGTTYTFVNNYSNYNPGSTTMSFDISTLTNTTGTVRRD